MQRLDGVSAGLTPTPGTILGQVIPRVPEVEGKIHAAVYQAIVE
jgi:hypothetical protein